MPSTLDNVLAVIDRSRAESLSGLIEFLRIPSVSTKAEHAPDMKHCAQWLAGQFQSCGLAAQVIATPGHPIVLARTPAAPDRPTVLVYGHYDVQPPEPLEQWISPPFQPAVRNNVVYARGACDDKGQVWAHVQALRSWHCQGGTPINLIFLIEGEEEIGSDHLENFIKSHTADLRADIAVVSDTAQFARGLPAITCGLRGLVYMEVVIKAVNHDLHSGVYGGAVPNPANILCEILGSLHDRDGRVLIDGFYDDVALLPEAQRLSWAALPFSDADFAATIGAKGLCGEKGYTTLERKWARPTCDINGLTSGYQGQGAKTIIPARASAKVSMRLVARQNPAKIQAAFEAFVRARCPASVTVEFAQFGLAEPVLTPVDTAAMAAATKAVERGFAAKPVLMREGGSIPVVALLKSVLNLDTLLIGFGLPDDGAHAPNEKFDLDALHGGTRTAALLYEELAHLTY